MPEPNGNSFFATFFSQIKGFIIPVLVSAVSAPILTLTAYKGLIQREPAIKNNSYLVYEIYCSQDSLKDVRFRFTLYDTSHLVFSDHRFVLMPQPPNPTYVNSTHRQLSGLPQGTIGTRVSKIVKGEYELTIPIQVKSKSGFSDGITGSLHISQGGEDFSAIRSYQFSDWFFFNPWKTAFLILFILIIISLMLNRKK